MAVSSTVTAGVDTVEAAQYNNLRTDVLDPTVGHDHEGVGGKILGTNALNDEAVTGAKIKDEAVTVDKIGPLAVTNPKIAVDAVNTAEILDSAVTAAKIVNRTRYAQVQVGLGYNYTDVSQLVPIAWVDPSSIVAGPVVVLEDSKRCRGTATIYLPADFTYVASSTKLTAVLFDHVGSGGNINAEVGTLWGADGESFHHDSEKSGFTTWANAATQYRLHFVTHTFVGSCTLATGDYITVYFDRDAVAAADTVGHSLLLLGFIFEYIADS